MCWNFHSKTFSWGNLARCCGQSTRVNGLVAAGFHLVALDAAGCWWHRRWLSDMERSGVRAGLISASCAPPRSTQACIWWTSIMKKIWTGLAAPRVEGLCLCHVISIRSYSPVALKYSRRARIYAHKPTHIHFQREFKHVFWHSKLYGFIRKLRHSKKSTATSSLELSLQLSDRHCSNHTAQ